MQHRKLRLSFAFVLFSTLYAFAQTNTFSGSVQDKAGNALAGAEVTLLQIRDSSVVNGTITDKDGKFAVAAAPGAWLLRIRYLGYADHFNRVRMTDLPVKMGNLVLSEQSTQLHAVDIVEKAPAAVLKGDTTEFNSAAFKVHPDATAEDLVTKMPGITVQNGTVQAQGEDVKQVLVDGKPYMGDDPNAALKNLPAEVIDKIQVFDKTSDQAAFTGFDDGNTSKTLNIITKARYRNGTFGRLFAGYGTDDAYKAGGNVNVFKDKRRISILAQFNNVNEQNFSTEDLLGVTASSGGGAGGGRNFGGNRGGGGGRAGGAGGGQQGDASTFLVNQSSGITKTNAIGVNYNDKWWNKADVTASYFFNFTNNTSVSDMFRQYYTQNNSDLSYAEHDEKISKNTNHRFNLRLDYMIDSFNSVLITPKISLQLNNGNSLVEGSNIQSGARINDTRNVLAPNLTGFNGNMPVLYRHRFAKKGRTVSIQATPGYNSNEGDSRLNAISHYYADTLTTDSLNQLSTLNKKGKVLSSNVVYTETVRENSQIVVNYGVNYNRTDSDKKTYDVVPFNETVNQHLSNVFNSMYLTQSGGVGYRYHKGIANLSAGVAFQWAELQNQQQFPFTADFKKDFRSVLPNLMMQFRFSKQQNLRIFYRTSNTPPSIDQLQNVVNNTNPLQLSAGNPDLKQDYQHSLNIRYSLIKPANSNSFFILLSGSTTQNYVANNTWFAARDTTVSGIFVTKGAQFSRPTNLDGYYNMRSFVNYSFPLFKKKLNLNLNSGVTFTRSPGLINGLQNNAATTGYSFGAVFASNISEKFDFTLSSNSAYSTVSNSLQTSLNTHYFNQNSRIKINILPWKGLVFSSDLTHTFYSGLSQSYNQRYLLWNAGIGYKFLKNRQAELKITAYDILKQNTNIQRNTTDLYIEDVHYNTLQRYYLLTFTYTLRQFPAENKPNGDFQNYRMDRMNH
jgi:hypothetical protein